MRLSNALGLAGLLLVAAVVLIATRPSTVRVEASRDASVPINVAWRVIGDPHQLAAWWPWLRAAGTNVTVEGEGSALTVVWKGPAETGSAALGDVKDGESVAWKLKRSEPARQSMTATVALVDRGGGLRLAWAIDLERRSFFAKLAGVFSNEEEELAADLAAGLTELDKLVVVVTRQEAERDEARRAAEAKARAAKAAVAQPAVLDVVVDPVIHTGSGDETPAVRTKRPSDFGPDRDIPSSSDG